MAPVPWPVLWLGTNAVQLTAPVGDHGQLMSAASGGSGALARPMASYTRSTADRRCGRRRPPDVLISARPMAEYTCSTADHRYKRRRPPDVPSTAHPVAQYKLNVFGASGQNSRQLLSIPRPLVKNYHQVFSSSTRYTFS